MSSSLIAIACSLQNRQDALRLEERIFYGIVSAAMYQVFNAMFEALGERALVVQLPEAEWGLQSTSFVRVPQPLGILVAALPKLGNPFTKRRKLLQRLCEWYSRYVGAEHSISSFLRLVHPPQIDALKENTAAVLLLEASLVGRAGGNSKPAAKEEKPKTEAKVKEEKKADPAPTKEELQQAVEEMPAGDTSYETLRALVLKLASGGKREEIKSVNAKHGLGNAKELLSNAEDFSSVKDQAKLEAYYADLLALEA
jgi:hypothetical protein